MINIIFNFLLGIPNVNGDEESGNPYLPDDDDTELKNYVIHKVDKPRFLCHIEYILAPEEQPKTVDIISWGNAAKIYVDEESAAVVPLTLDKICWIYFRVRHVTTIKNRSVNDLINHNIKVSVSTNGKKLGNEARSEKVTMFYGCRFIDKSITLFPPLWEDLTKRYDENHNKVLSTNFETNELSMKLKKILIKLTKEYDSGVGKQTALEKEHPPWRNLQDANATQNSDPNGRTDNQEVANNKNLKTDLTFIISGESILSGLKILENHVKYNSQELPFLSCVTKIHHLFTSKEATSVNPLSVTLKSLKFLQTMALQKENIRKIRFSFVVYDKFEVESNDIEIDDDNIILNYTRTILTEWMDMPELIEFIQTKGFKVKMMGIRESESNGAEKIKASVYHGQKINCKSSLPGRGKKIQPCNHPQIVLLGIAHIDISPILLQPHRLSVHCNFICRHAPLTSSSFFTTINPTEVNGRVTPRCDNLCRILTSSPTVLSITVRLGSSICNKYSFRKPHIPGRNRIVIIINDIFIAINILKIIQSQDELFVPIDYAKTIAHIGRPLSIYHESKETRFPLLTLTGFLIDCVDYYLIYVEGPNSEAFQDIWSIANLVEPPKGRMLYDSSLLFNGIFHEELIRYGGFYVISLRQSIHHILKNTKEYKIGNIPKPAYQALTQLHQLSNCPSMMVAVQNDLLPDYHSLLSLDLEFGIPLKFS